MKGYGSTAPPTPTPRGDGSSSNNTNGNSNDNNSSNNNNAQYSPHVHQHRPAPGQAPLPRNESAGATTVETEPLLGERLLAGHDQPCSDGSANAHDKLALRDGGNSANARTPTRAGSPSKKIHSIDSDPHIGLSVVTNEVDTLVYSHSRDDISLLTRARQEGLLPRILSPSAHVHHPPFMLLCLGLAVGVTISGIGALGYEYYHHHGKLTPTEEDGGIASSSEGTWYGVPYSKIGRESFGDPASSIMDASLFHPSLLGGGRGPQKDGANPGADASPKPFLRVPFPTSAFWTNLVLAPPEQQQGQSTSRGDQYSYPVVAYPFSFQWSPSGKLQASYSAARRVVRPKSIQDAFAPDVTVGSMEEISARHVVRFDSLSVTLRFYADGGAASDSESGGGGTWETYLVQGSPYITAKYSGLAPELTALSDFDDIVCPPTLEGEDPGQFRQGTRGDGRPEGGDRTIGASAAPIGKKLGICAVAPSSSKQKKVVVGVQFVVTTKEKMTWLLFASEPLSFEFDQAARRTIRARESFGGVIRLALVPPPASSAGINKSTSFEGTAAKSLDVAHLASSPGVKRLIYHAGAYPTGGSVWWSFRSGARQPLVSSTFPNIAPNKSDHNKQHHRRAFAERENNIGTITFAFDTIQMNYSNSNVPLLTLVLPHHVHAINSADELILRQEDFDLVYNCIKGQMVPVVGNSWSYEEELTFMGFGDELLPAKTNIAQHSTSAASGRATSRRPIIHETTAILTLDQSIRDLLLQTVESDLTVNLPVLTDGAYGFGKQIARIAQLAHVAKVVDAANARKVKASVDSIKNAKNITNIQTASPSLSSSVPSDATSAEVGSGTTRRAYALLEKYLTMWLIGDEGNKHLVYDAQLGGVLSMLGISDTNADFGNSRYNDHHFHYGYVLYASAILGKANPKFVSQYGPFVDALFYDVAHNNDVAKSNNDRKEEIFFPLARHKSFFDGHSFASGLFPSANGKSQESSSEAVNCYYGAYLWARVRWGGTGDEHRLVDFTRLLIATEMTGAKTYWHMAKVAASDNNLIPYNTQFRENYMVGNLGMTDVTCSTWFGSESIYVHLINFLPVTAITAELFDKEYVKGEQSALNNSASAGIAWDGYSICNKAIVDPNNAWVEALRLVSNKLDTGISKSQVLFWVSTRGGFLAGTTMHGYIDTNSSAPSNQPNSAENADSLAECTSHDMCVAKKLVGKCCPTDQGVFLQCCA